MHIHAALLFPTYVRQNPAAACLELQSHSRTVSKPSSIYSSLLSAKSRLLAVFQQHHPLLTHVLITASTLRGPAIPHPTCLQWTTTALFKTQQITMIHRSRKTSPMATDMGTWTTTTSQWVRMSPTGLLSTASAQPEVSPFRPSSLRSSTSHLRTASRVIYGRRLATLHHCKLLYPKGRRNEDTILTRMQCFDRLPSQPYSLIMPTHGLERCWWKWCFWYRFVLPF